MTKIFKTLCLVAFCLMASALVPNDYPIDGYNTTDIRRLRRLQLSIAGDLPDAGLPVGAFKSINDIHLNLTSRKKDSVGGILKENASLQQKINTLFPKLDKSYSVAILDITDPANLRYAQQNETRGYQPGSVGKLAVLTGLFMQLAKSIPTLLKSARLYCVIRA